MGLPGKVLIFKSCKLFPDLVYQQFVLTSHVMTNKANIIEYFGNSESWRYIQSHVP